MKLVNDSEVLGQTWLLLDRRSEVFEPGTVDLFSVDAAWDAARAQFRATYMPPFLIDYLRLEKWKFFNGTARAKRSHRSRKLRT